MEIQKSDGLFNADPVTRETIQYCAREFGWKQTDEYEKDGEWSNTYRTESGIKIAVDSVDELHGENTNNIFVKTPVFDIQTVYQYYTLVGLLVAHTDEYDNEMFISAAPYARSDMPGESPTDSGVQTVQNEHVPYSDVAVVEINIETQGYSGPYAVVWTGRTGDTDVEQFENVIQHMNTINTYIQSMAQEG